MNNVLVALGTGAGLMTSNVTPTSGWSNNVTAIGMVTHFAGVSGNYPDFTIASGASALIGMGTTGNGVPADDLGFDPKCLVKKVPTMIGMMAKGDWWQHSIDYDYIKSIGGVARCFNPKARSGAPDIGSYANGPVTTAMPIPARPPRWALARPVRPRRRSSGLGQRRRGRYRRYRRGCERRRAVDGGQRPWPDERCRRYAGGRQRTRRLRLPCRSWLVAGCGAQRLRALLGLLLLGLRRRRPTMPLSERELRQNVWLLGLGAGLGAASLYYNQPMLGTLATELRVSPAAIGHVPTLTQLGYAGGILFLAPFGDRYDRRRIILLKGALLTLALLAMSLAGSLTALCVLSVIVGVAATLAQDCVPAAAALAPVASRGKTVGSVMTGLLLGILLSRVVSGAVTQLLGFRAMFGLAAALVLGLTLLMARRLPSFEATTALPYRALLASLFSLLGRHPGLRRAALAQGLLSAAFSAFWSTLAVMLHAPPFGYGSTVAGAFGLAGAAGALAAPVAGSIADRRGPGAVTRTGALLVLASFAAFALWPGNLTVLIAGTLLFDLGVQASLIAHQSIIYGLEPAARSRLNAVLIGIMFIGMSSGAALGAEALAPLWLARRVRGSGRRGAACPGRPAIAGAPVNEPATSAVSSDLSGVSTIDLSGHSALLCQLTNQRRDVAVGDGLVQQHALFASAPRPPRARPTSGSSRSRVPRKDTRTSGESARASALVMPCTAAFDTV